MWATASQVVQEWVEWGDGGGAASPRPQPPKEWAAVSELVRHERKTLGLILCRNALPPLKAYVAAMQQGHAAMLLDHELGSALLDRVLSAYEPHWVVQRADRPALPGYDLRERHGEWVRLAREHQPTYPINSGLALLLSTSGSTGSPKCVRLSYANLEANASSICEYLSIAASDLAITTLPFSYSYGLSVINSHLRAQAKVVLTDASMASRAFWDGVARNRVTSMAGVPFTYQMLKRLGPESLPLESIRTLTQAGGNLGRELTEYFSTLSVRSGWRFFVMYGQTEATARISYVPPDRLPQKIGSIGVAIPGGRLRVDASGELIYEGPNVMMGYADSLRDLDRGDELGGLLRTGDLGLSDDDGYFFLQGRMSRFVKLHGNRIGLDLVEQRLEEALGAPVAVVGDDDGLLIVAADGTPAEAVRHAVRELFGFRASLFDVRLVPSLPMTAAGKKDYRALWP